MIAPRDYIIELKPNPIKWLSLLLASLAFVVGGVFLLHENKFMDFAIGILGMIFGIIGILTSLTCLFSKRMTLQLTPQGFSYGTLRKKYFYKWSDIAVFGVGSIGVKKACFTLRTGFAGEEKIRAINQCSIGFDHFLPDTYGKKPMELAKILEDWRQQHA